MADCSKMIVKTVPGKLTGQFIIDDKFLRDNGVTDLSKYKRDDVREEDLVTDFYVG